MRSPVELTAAVRQAGGKVTPQRQLLFQLLHDNTTHPCAEALFAVASARMPGISLRTVYQTLNDLVALGELQVLDLGTGAARFDPNLDDHHHLVCDGCGAVHDVRLLDPAGIAPAGATEAAAGFEISTTQVVFRGRCASCRNRAASGGTVGEVPSHHHHEQGEHHG